MSTTHRPVTTPGQLSPDGLPPDGLPPDGLPPDGLPPDKLPPHAAVAVDVLRLADEPDTDAGDLAAAISVDPALAGHVMRVANSSYYGLSGRVGSLRFAVSAIGFHAVRAVAAAAAAGLADPGSAPVGFWQAAATTAVLCEALAPRLGADPGDAFAVGLLHLVGAGVLHEPDRPLQLCLPAQEDEAVLLHAERERYGIDHATAGGSLLAHWRLPERLWSVIARHHDRPLPDASRLERTLHTARTVADQCLAPGGSGSGDRDGEPGPAAAGPTDVEWLTDGVLGSSDLPSLVILGQQRGSALLQGLPG